MDNNIYNSKPKTITDTKYLQYISKRRNEIEITDGKDAAVSFDMACEMVTQFELIEGNLKWLLSKHGKGNQIKQYFNGMKLYYYDFMEHRIHCMEDLKTLVIYLFHVFYDKKPDNQLPVPHMFDDYTVRYCDELVLFIFDLFRKPFVASGMINIEELLQLHQYSGDPFIFIFADRKKNPYLQIQIVPFGMDEVRAWNNEKQGFHWTDTYFDELVDYCVLNGLLDGYRDYIDKKNT
jgi:hypothetical protein